MEIPIVSGNQRGRDIFRANITFAEGFFFGVGHWGSDVGRPDSVRMAAKPRTQPDMGKNQRHIPWVVLWDWGKGASGKWEAGQSLIL